MSQKEIKLIGGKVGEAPKGYRRQEPLEAREPGIPDALRRRVRNVSLMAALSLGPRRVPGSPDAEERIVHTCEREERTDVPGIGLKLYETLYGRNLCISEALVAGKDVSTPAGLTVKLLRVKDGGSVAEVSITAPWLKEAMPSVDVRGGRCVTVPCPGGREAWVRAQYIHDPAFGIDHTKLNGMRWYREAYEIPESSAMAVICIYDARAETNK